MSSESLDWKSLIDVDLPKYILSYTLQNRKIGYLHTTSKEYEEYHRKSLDTQLP